ncbi:MAG TPA: hypothetical protein GXZ59_02780 [Clostridiaceae bacterium]|nr:hypothetical protein [Clostridiaceae bacterium]
MILIYGPFDKLILNTEANIIADNHYYQGQNYITEEVSLPYQALSYDLSLNVNLNLQAKVSVCLQGELPPELHFTLYHGYKLKNVTDADGHALDFRQVGDHITVLSPDNKQDTLIFTYSGSSPRFLCNYQCISLPGFFAYYPRVGFRNLYFNDINFPSFAPQIESEEMDFTVRVKSFLPVFCNLHEVASGEFTGRANGISLVSGLLAETNIDGHKIVYPFLDPENDQIALQTNAGMEDSELNSLAPGKALLFHNSISSSPYEQFAEFSDHYCVDTLAGLPFYQEEVKVPIQKSDLYRVYDRLQKDEKLFYVSLNIMLPENLDDLSLLSSAQKVQIKIAEHVDKFGIEPVKKLVAEYLYDDNDHRTLNEFFSSLSELEEPKQTPNYLPYYKRGLQYLLDDYHADPTSFELLKYQYMELASDPDFAGEILTSDLYLLFVGKIEEIGEEQLLQKCDQYLGDVQDQRSAKEFLREMD